MPLVNLYEFSSGGRCGSWDPRDHDLFLKGVTKYVGVDLAMLVTPSKPLLNKLLALIPSKNEEELKEHIQWFIRHESLKKEKKSVLEDWKKERLRRVVTAFEDNIATAFLPSENSAVEPLSARDSPRREETRERLRRWREEKDAERRREEEERRVLEIAAETRRQEVVVSHLRI